MADLPFEKSFHSFFEQCTRVYIQYLGVHSSIEDSDFGAALRGRKAAIDDID